MTVRRRIPTIRWRGFAAALPLVLAPVQVLAHASRTPTPGDIWSVWTLSPIPAFALLIVAWLYARGVAIIWRTGGIGRGIRRWQAGCFAAGVLAVAIAILSPLDTMGDALLAAHMTQHMLLLVVAPPLLVLGAPMTAMLVALPRAWRSRMNHGWHHAGPLPRVWHALNHPGVAWGIAAIVLWGWHVPLAYEAALRYPIIHDLEHAMFLASSTLFWWAVIQPLGRRRHTFGTSLLLLFTTALQGSALGVLMTFSNILWYPLYDNRTAPWQLTALQDQHIAGAVMWVPGGIVYLLGILLVLGTWLSKEESQPDHPPLASTGHRKGVEQWVGN